MVDVEKNDSGDSVKEKPTRGVFDDSIDYKNVGLLSKCLSEGGRIIPSRVTGTPFKIQRKKRRAILRARFLGLLPYVRK